MMNPTNEIVPIGTLRPNPWNPNEMSPFMVEKARESIRQFGFVDPVLVRFAAGESQLEIIDGEQRWRASIAEGMHEIEVTNLGMIPDSVAKQLTIVLNETRGTFDRAELGRLIADLIRTDEAVAEATRAVLPYTDREIDAYVKAGEFDWLKLEEGGDDGNGTSTFTPTKSFKVKCNRAQLRTIRGAITHAIDTHRASNEGEALELLSTFYPGKLAT